ncbi:collagen alpha-2(I) chain-like [Microtus ochrogaster]|uniref:Collagen alpha-2(I) chain-like n=1 Tax=Microtus ochrogaster TaxID=79684 RepID=A0ABM1UE29_MICOH|nr:collagen alpha-2(I) chain-like [Microtus ochrogaster]
MRGAGSSGACGSQGGTGTRGDRAAPGTVSSERRRLPVTTTTAAQSKPALQAWPDEPRDAGHAGNSGRLGGSAPVRGPALAHSGARVHPSSMPQDPQRPPGISVVSASTWFPGNIGHAVSSLFQA